MLNHQLVESYLLVEIINILIRNYIILSYF